MERVSPLTVAYKVPGGSLASVRVWFVSGFVSGFESGFVSGSCLVRVWVCVGFVSGSCLVRVRFVSGSCLGSCSVCVPVRVGSGSCLDSCLGSCRICFILDWFLDYNPS